LHGSIGRESILPDLASDLNRETRKRCEPRHLFGAVEVNKGDVKC